MKRRAIPPEEAEAISDALLETLELAIRGLDQEDPRTTNLIQLLTTAGDNLRQNDTPSPDISLSDLQRAQLDSVNLHWKPNAKSQARQAGASEIDGGMVTFEQTKAYINFTRDHVATAKEGCRIIIDQILLRVVSIVSTGKDRLFLIPKYPIPATSVTPTYCLIKYPTEYSSSILGQPVATLARPDLKNVGSSHLFQAENLAQMESILPQIIIATTTWHKLNNKACGRGVVTCGEWWTFFAFETPKDYKTGRFGCVEPLRIGEDAGDLDLILGILMDWVDHPESFEDQQYFSVE